MKRENSDGRNSALKIPQTKVELKFPREKVNFRKHPKLLNFLLKY